MYHKQKIIPVLYIVNIKLFKAFMQFSSIQVLYSCDIKYIKQIGSRVELKRKTQELRTTFSIAWAPPPVSRQKQHTNSIRDPTAITVPLIPDPDPNTGPTHAIAQHTEKSEPGPLPGEECRQLKRAQQPHPGHPQISRQPKWTRKNENHQNSRWCRSIPLKQNRNSPSSPLKCRKIIYKHWRQWLKSHI